VIDSHEITTRSSLSMQLPAATQSRPSCQIMLAHHHHRSSSSVFLRLILSFTQPYYSYNHQPLASYVVSNSSWLLVRWPMHGQPLHSRRRPPRRAHARAHRHGAIDRSSSATAAAGRAGSPSAHHRRDSVRCRCPPNHLLVAIDGERRGTPLTKRKKGERERNRVEIWGGLYGWLVRHGSG
jgi:hypothetical protein